MKRAFLAAIALSGVAFAAVPDSDARQTNLADFKTHFTMREYTTRKQWDARKTRLRQQILSAAGLLPMPARTPLRPKTIRRIEYSDYAIDTVIIETLPGYFLAGNLYRPVNRKPPFPAVVLPHGHWKRGRLENQPTYSVPALGINLARQGYVVFAYDMVGYNDTRQTPHDFSGWQEDLWSFHPLGLQLWNSLRAVDFLVSLPDVDSRRIAATGASGGGTQTFLLAAVDDRIAFAAPVNMISAYMQGGDPCEEAPNLRLDTFNVEIAAMIAPRPLLIVSSTHDWTRHTPEEELPAIRRVYALYGVPLNARNVHVDAEHNYNRESREAVYHFLAKYMQPDLPAAELVDRDCIVPADEELLAFPRGDLPKDTLGYTDVFQQWKAASLTQLQGINDPAELRDALRLTLAAAWPSRVDDVIDGDQIYLAGAGRNDRVRGYWRPGTGAPALVIHPGGPAAALRTDAVAALLRSGRPVLILRPFTSTFGRVQKQDADRYFLSYNRSDAADRVQDILTALAFLRSRYRARPTLLGLEDGGVWALFAAAVAPIDVELVADLNNFGGSDQDFRERFFVPGIQRAGGLATALKLVAHTRTLTTTTAPGTDDRF